MNIYIVAATEHELVLTRNWCKLNFAQSAINTFTFRRYKIHFAVHGIGLLASTYHIQRICMLKPHLIIQVGIAGSLTEKIKIGDTVRIEKECLGDFGAEDNDGFLSIFDLGLLKENDAPFHKKWIENNSKLPVFFDKIKNAKGTTVQKISGNKKTIAQLKEKFNPDVESMEGAALHYVCNNEKINYVQLRCISNKVEVRDKSKWKINDAIQNLNNILIQYFKTL